MLATLAESAIRLIGRLPNIHSPKRLSIIPRRAAIARPLTGAGREAVFGPALMPGEGATCPEGALTYQPRASAASPWVAGVRKHEALKGRDSLVVPVQGLAPWAFLTQGDATLALGWNVPAPSGRHSRRSRL